MLVFVDFSKVLKVTYAKCVFVGILPFTLRDTSLHFNH